MYDHARHVVTLTYRLLAVRLSTQQGHSTTIKLCSVLKLIVLYNLIAKDGLCESVCVPWELLQRNFLLLRHVFMFLSAIDRFCQDNTVTPVLDAVTKRKMHKTLHFQEKNWEYAHKH